MKAVWKNPFRILGVYSNSGERDKQKNRSMINAYLGSRKSIQLSVDFPFLPRLDRTDEMLVNAINSLQTNHDKLMSSLFWFSSMNHIDESAFHYLNDGNTEKACEIWSKITDKRDIAGNYLSAYNNLSTLRLCLAFNSDPIDTGSIVLSINLIEKMTLSDYLLEYVAAVTDKTYEPDASKILNEYFEIMAETLYSLDQDTEDIELVDELLHYSTLPSILKNLIAQKDILYLSRIVEKCKTERIAGDFDLMSQAEALSNDSFSRIKRVGEILGDNNAQYVSIADKVGLEILQCGMDYLYECEDDMSKDPIDWCKSILSLAESMVRGKLAKQRVEHNAEEIEDWVIDRQKNLKIERVQDYYDEIQERFEIFENSKSDFDSINRMLKISLPFLLCIREVLGDKDEFYLDLSSQVANLIISSSIDILNPMIKEANKLSEKYEKSGDPEIDSMLHYIRNRELIDKYNSTKWQCKWVLDRLLNLDLDKNTNSRLKTNLEKLK